MLCLTKKNGVEKLKHGKCNVGFARICNEVKVEDGSIVFPKSGVLDVFLYKK